MQVGAMRGMALRVILVGGLAWAGSCGGDQAGQSLGTDCCTLARICVGCPCAKDLHTIIDSANEGACRRTLDARSPACGTTSELSALAFCSKHHGDPYADTGANSGPVKGPPLDAVFTKVQVDCGTDPSMPMYCDRYLFNTALAKAFCVVPDADSFDDYEDAQLGIPRGVTPLSSDCPADGIATGPLQSTLYPSKWCRVPDCTPMP